jgi:hypothetical protein
MKNCTKVKLYKKGFPGEMAGNTSKKIMKVKLIKEKI